MRAALLSLALVAAAGGPAAAQLDQWGYWENGVTESWWLSSGDFAKEDAVNAAALWKRIGEPTPADGAGGWAGDYFRGGSTSGTYVRWSPEGGFIIAGVNKCEARVVALTYGKVNVTPTVIHFFPEFSKAAAPHGHAHGARRAADPLAAMRFVPVEWLGERLLINEGEMGSFGDYVAGLGEYNFWLGTPHFFAEDLIGTQFYAKTVPEFVAAAGEGGREAEAEAAPVEAAAAPGEGEQAEAAPPVVPPGYERFLKKPIEATVTAVGGRRVRRKLSFKNESSEVFYGHVSLTDVTIDAGTEHGLKPGMFLLARDAGEVERIRIVRAGKRSSTGYVIRELAEDGSETVTDGDDARRPRPKVAAGWKLTTSPF
ncbi:MAG TPA: hypothetical protein VIP46_21225 [Pyrinomonadaceae bacterium]